MCWRFGFYYPRVKERAHSSPKLCSFIFSIINQIMFSFIALYNLLVENVLKFKHILLTLNKEHLIFLYANLQLVDNITGIHILAWSDIYLKLYFAYTCIFYSSYYWTKCLKIVSQKFIIIGSWSNKINVHVKCKAAGCKHFIYLFSSFSSLANKFR